MKQKLLILLLSVATLSSCYFERNSGIQNTVITLPPEPDLSSGRTPCVNGFAGPYPCQGYDLMTLIRRDELLGPLFTQEYGYVWGWTDPMTQKEYALVGSTAGVFFLDVSDPEFPVHIGQIISFGPPHHRQIIRTYQNRAYIVGNSEDYALKVFDLTRLRDANPNEFPITFTEDHLYDEFWRASRISINEDSGYAFVTGTTTFSGGPHFVDISNPSVALPAGGYDNDGSTLTATVVNYDGPDPDHQGKEILVGCNEGKVVVVDVTNKNNPTNISTIEYEGATTPVYGQFTQDKRYYIVGDFLDESVSGLNTRTIILDFEDLDNPKEYAYHIGPTRANDFGGQIDDDIYYLANLTAGARMVSLSSIDNGHFEEVGHFDTYPQNDAPLGYIGATNIYPFFQSGNILVNDLYGIFIIRKSR